ncbi:SDR family NAD(P)-dependent oxidoreductase [Rhizorhabdus dicambivorans]|nr:SDR family oxidoreductase [Rhizorhabdus dicambivorans]
MALEDPFRAARLDGRAYVVLGAGGGGLGDAACRALAGAGADLMCVDRSAERAQAIAAAVGGVPHVADAIDRDDMVALFAEAADRFGNRFAGVVDIVGMAMKARIGALDDMAVGRQIDIVLRHAMLATEIAGPMLAERGGGSLTFIGSLAGMTASPNQTVYGIAKAALHQYVRCAAQELGPSGVRVNAVVPGFVATPRLLDLLPAEAWARIAGGNPLRRVAVPDDIARAILFLVSDLAGYVTGVLLNADGGQALALPGADVLR